MWDGLGESFPSFHAEDEGRTPYVGSPPLIPCSSNAYDMKVSAAMTIPAPSYGLAGSATSTTGEKIISDTLAILIPTRA